jgi:YcxB-like protein
MELRYQLTAADLSHCLQKQFAARVFRVWLILGVVAVGAVLVTHATSGGGSGLDSMWLANDLKSALFTIGPLFIVAALWLLYYWFGIPRLAAKQFLQLKSLQREKHLQISDAGIRFADETGNSLVPWGDLLRWSRSELGFVIYLADRHFLIVPKRAFATIEKAVEFQDHLISHKVPMK